VYTSIVKATTLATYEEALRKKFVDRMRSDAQVIPAGNDEDGLSWTLRFTETGMADVAWSELERLELSSVSERAASRKISIPRHVTEGEEEQDVLVLLRIQPPSSP